MGHVRHKQRELTRASLRALFHRLKNPRRGRRAVGDDQNTSGLMDSHAAPFRLLRSEQMCGLRSQITWSITTRRSRPAEGSSPKTKDALTPQRTPRVAAGAGEPTCGRTSHATRLLPPEAVAQTPGDERGRVSPRLICFGARSEGLRTAYSTSRLDGRPSCAFVRQPRLEPTASRPLASLLHSMHVSSVGWGGRNSTTR